MYARQLRMFLLHEYGFASVRIGLLQASDFFISLSVPVLYETDVTKTTRTNIAKYHSETCVFVWQWTHPDFWNNRYFFPLITEYFLLVSSYYHICVIVLIFLIAHMIKATHVIKTLRLILFRVRWSDECHQLSHNAMLISFQRIVQIRSIVAECI